MKFCRTCGAQYTDEAAFCANCGNVLDSAPVNPNPAPTYAPNMAYAQPAPAPAAPLLQPKKKQTGAVFGFLFDICLLLYSVFSFLSIVFAWVYTSIYPSGYYSYSYHATSNYWLDETCIVLAFIMSMPLLAFGIVSFVFGLKEKEDDTKKFAGLTRFITGIVLFIVAIIVMSVHG